MGVQNLWSILAPIQCHKPLNELKGQVIAVDLSIWVCESQGVKQMQAVVLKPFLRNLFFRITNLRQLGIRPVFVIEGEAPELKCETMMKRQKSQYHGRSSRTAAPKSKKTGRSHFKARLKECCEMLDYLGIPWVQSKGEAEAMCAFLNIKGLVDACITQDGDAFLYGARVVYRNFTLNNKDPHIDCYCMDDIETKLGLNQRSLVGLGILLGCDYVPKGVPGVGKEGAMKLVKALDNEVDILQRFSEWHQGFSYQSTAERDVMRKALSVPGFPNQAVIDEFLVIKDKQPKQTFHWTRPNLAKIKTFNQVKLDWPNEYTEEKVLPMISSHDMNQIIEHGIGNCSNYLKPVEIVKTRVRQGVQCVEVHWQRQEMMSCGDTDKPEFYTTVENLEQFQSAFPEIVKNFLDAKNSKTKKKTKKSSASTSGCDLKEETTDIGSLTDAVSKICLTESNDISTGGMAEHPKAKSSKYSKKEHKKICSKENIDVPGDLLKHTLTAFDDNHQKILQSCSGNHHDKEEKIAVVALQQLPKKDVKIEKSDYLSNNDKLHEGHGHEPLLFPTAEMNCKDEHILKKESSSHDGVMKKKSSCKNSKSSNTNLKQNTNNASYTSSSVNDCIPQTQQIKNDGTDDVNLGDSWIEEVFLELETRYQKNISVLGSKGISDKTMNGDDNDVVKYKNSQREKRVKCQKQLVKKTGSKNEENKKVKDEELPEVLPLCERLIMKSVLKKKSRQRKENKKDVKKVIAVEENQTDPDASILKNATPTFSNQFKEETPLEMQPSHCELKVEATKGSSEKVDDIPCTTSHNTDSISHPSNSNHFLLFDILNESESEEILTTEANFGAGKINDNQMNVLEHKNISLHDANVEPNTEHSVLADDTKFDFTDLDFSSSFQGLDSTGCGITPKLGSSNVKETYPKNTEQVDISFEGQIQKDFPDLFNCTLPSLLTGGELVSPATDHHVPISKSVLSEVTLPNHDKNEKDVQCNLFTKKNDIPCHQTVQFAHVQIAESPEPVSLADRLKQRLGNCKDAKTLQTIVL